jgi:predicted DNA-binding transcriptional regulator YafY
MRIVGFGPTKTSDKEVEDVHVLFIGTAVNYVLTKLLHPSQRKEEVSDGSLIVKLKLITNYELESVILGFGDKVEVLLPIDLRIHISERLFNASSQYNR